MYRKRKNRTKKIIWIGLSIFVLFFALFYALTSSHLSGLEMILKDATVVVQKIAMAPFTTLNGEKGKTMTESYTIQKNVNVHLEEEIEELKKLLELNHTLTEYTPVNAMVLSRNRSYWFQNITIDKGKKDGVQKDMLVITSEGLIGKIAKVSYLSSEVSLITMNDVNYKISVSIAGTQGESFAILNGYDSEKGLLKLTGVDKNASLEIGNVITTSGLGGMYPKGIFIGTVEKIEEDKYGLSKTVYVKSKQDFNKIHYVTVLKEKTA